MPPKAAEKKPTTGGKAPAGKAPAEKKEAGKKTAAPPGDKKKRNKARKETYSSYIYKGIVALSSLSGHIGHFAPSLPFDSFCEIPVLFPFPNFADSTFSPEASSPRYGYLKPCHVYPELLRKRYVFLYSRFQILIFFIQIFLSVSQPKHQSSPPIIRSLPFHLERSKHRMLSLNLSFLHHLTKNVTRVRLILPGELAKHAVSEGTKAVTKYSSSTK